MLLTKEKIERSAFSPSSKEKFLSNFPSGADIKEILDICDEKEVFILLEYFNLNEEEEKACQKKINIENSKAIVKSFNILDSEQVIQSKEVNSSKNILHSSFVSNSEKIRNSSNVKDSKNIYNSEFVIESNQVFKSDAITKSNNVIYSEQVANSMNVALSNNIFFSGEIIKCFKIEDSFFCSSSSNLSNCCFCYGIQDKSFYFFNKPLSEKKYKMVLEQYHTWMNYNLSFIEDWNVNKNFVPTKTDFRKYFKSLPNSFWKWVETLPNYDPKILYNITLFSSFLKGT